MAFLVSAAVLAAGALFVVLRLAVAGSVSPAVTAFLAPVTLLALVASVFRIGIALGFVAPTRSLVRRHGFWVVFAGTAVGLPTLGASGLVDPWETHYAEVAREMLVRHDFVSPWWANEGWFKSKPVLLFWLEALSMKVLGVATAPDKVLASGGHPEWAVRFPGFAVALVGVYLLYNGVARTYGRRPALIGAIALWTMPGFALLSRQAMTDMPLVAGIAGALGCVLRAIDTEDDVLAHRWVSRSVAIAIALTIVPQLLVIALQPHLVAGSPSTCHLPGHPACAAIALAHPRLTPILQVGIWIAPTGWLVVHAWEETRSARLFALAAWGCAAFAAMAKGPAGFCIPGAAVLVTLVLRRSFRPLLRLEILEGLLLAAVMILPWYVAIYARHGRPFVQELVQHHMLGRALEHLHDTNEGEDVGLGYFIRQLGYATFPWTGLAAVGLIAWPDRSRRGLARVLLLAAAIISFALVSSMRTKFHHYVLIALPPIAMLTGLRLHELLARGRSRWTTLGWIVAACTTAYVGRQIVTTAHGTRGPASFILLLTYRYARQWPSTHSFRTVFLVLAAVATLALVAGAFHRVRRWALSVLASTAFALTLILLNIYLPGCAADGGQRDVMERYYAANDRQGPLIAYQLNWKGENFYTGDALAIFISSGVPLRTYLEQRRAREERTVYFVTERGRVRGLKHELGRVSAFDELTGPKVSAEFTLVRTVL